MSKINCTVKFRANRRLGGNVWTDFLVCPLDRTPLVEENEGWRCPACGFTSAATVVNGVARPDFRALGVDQDVAYTFRIPVAPLEREAVARDYFRAANQDFPHYRRAEVRRQFGTKLDKGIQYYCQQLWRERGAAARILDLGCGQGGNRRYLRSLGFEHVITTDWIAPGADMLVDAHRLPFADATFDLVISTAVFEHLYNPYLAMHEIARVSQPDGYFLGSASFWEAWHGSSYFHLTPDGWHALLSANDMQLVDLWPGWGIIPAALTHVLTPGYLRGVGYALQSAVEAVYRLALGERGVRRLHLRASGAYVVCGKKQISGLAGERISSGRAASGRV